MARRGWATGVHPAHRLDDPPPPTPPPPLPPSAGSWAQPFAASSLSPALPRHRCSAEWAAAGVPARLWPAIPRTAGSSGRAAGSCAWPSNCWLGGGSVERLLLPGADSAAARFGGGRSGSWCSGQQMQLASRSSVDGQQCGRHHSRHSVPSTASHAGGLRAAAGAVGVSGGGSPCSLAAGGSAPGAAGGSSRPAAGSIAPLQQWRRWRQPWKQQAAAA